MGKEYCVNSTCSGYCDCNCNNCKSDTHLRGRRLRHEQGRDPIHRQHHLCLLCRRSWKDPFVIQPDTYYLKSTDEEVAAYAAWITGNKEVRCGLCGTKSTPVGPDCRAPPHRDLKGWKKLSELLATGSKFSSCRYHLPNRNNPLNKPSLPNPEPDQNTGPGLYYLPAEGVWEFRLTA
jgi:hypothetical protein